METLTRLVAESLARHGFDRPVDYRRLEWSRWFRCQSHHSLLVVPSRPGVFALAEEIMDLPATNHVETAASAVPRREASSPTTEPGTQIPDPRRMLAVTHFFEDDDMAYVLDRMLSHPNPMRARLASGRYFVRYVVIADPAQRSSICNALNQWIASSSEKATGIGSHFATSLEHVETAPSAVQATAKPSATTTAHVETAASAVPRREASGATTAHTTAAAKNDQRRVNSAPQLNSAIATNIHCSSSFPSGF